MVGFKVDICLIIAADSESSYIWQCYNDVTFSFILLCSSTSMRVDKILTLALNITQYKQTVA